MRILLYLILTFGLFCSCNKSENTITPDINWGGDTSDQTVPDSLRANDAYVWVSCEGNWEEFANSKENIVRDIARLKDCGFTDLVVDVRPTNGGVLFKSTHAEPQTRMDCWTDGGYRFINRTADFDYLQTFIDEGHKQGLRVHAVINTFVGGCLCPFGLGSDGMLFEDSSKKSWASVVNTSEGLKNTMDLLDDSVDYGAKFLSPINPQVQDYVLGIIAENRNCAVVSTAACYGCYCDVCTLRKNALVSVDCNTCCGVGAINCGGLLYGLFRFNVAAFVNL